MRSAPEDTANLPLFAFAHDLRQPLRAIILRSQALLRRETFDQAAVVEAVRGIIAAARLQDSLIASVVEFSDADPAEHGTATQLLPLAVQGALMRLEATRAASGGRILAAGLPEVRVSAAVGTIIEKLLSNALKFCPASGAPEVTVTAEIEADHVQVCLTDAGIGIPSEYRLQVFEPFKRLHPAGAFPGHGMGLAIGRRLAKCMAGSLEIVDPPLGVGTRVVLRAPIL